MSFSFRLGRFSWSAAALALLAGCSNGGSQSATPAFPASLQQQAARATSLAGARARSFSHARVQAPLFARPVVGPGFVSSEVDAKGGAAVYVSDYSADTVTVFSSAGKQTAQATGFSYPEGVTGATDGDIYVANTGVSAIEVYSAGLKKLVATLSDTGNYPSDASVDTKTGAVGVANISATSGAAGSVTFFAKGATTPCATVTASNWNEVYFAAFDAQGDLYIDGFDSNDNVLVGVVNGGCKATKITTLAGAKIKYPGGIQIAASGDILIDDQSAATVYTYKPPVKNKFGSPAATTPLSGAGDPVAISLNSTSKDVYDVDGSLLEAQEFAYPKGGAALQSFVPSGATYTLGVFVTPDSQP